MMAEVMLLLPLGQHLFVKLAIVFYFNFTYLL